MLILFLVHPIDTLCFFLNVINADGAVAKRTLLCLQVMRVRTQLLMNSKEISRLTKRKMAVKSLSKVSFAAAVIHLKNSLLKYFQANHMSCLSAHMPTANKPQNLFKNFNLGMSYLFMVCLLG